MLSRKRAIPGRVTKDRSKKRDHHHCPEHTAWAPCRPPPKPCGCGRGGGGGKWGCQRTRKRAMACSVAECLLLGALHRVPPLVLSHRFVMQSCRSQQDTQRSELFDLLLHRRQGRGGGGVCSAKRQEAAGGWGGGGSSAHAKGGVPTFRCLVSQTPRLLPHQWARGPMQLRGRGAPRAGLN